MQKKKLSKKGKIAAVGDRAPGSLLGRARGLAWPNRRVHQKKKRDTIGEAGPT